MSEVAELLGEKGLSVEIQEAFKGERGSGSRFAIVCCIRANNNEGNCTHLSFL